MPRSFFAILVALCVMSIAVPARAQKGLAVGLHAGTLGPGLELTTGVTSSLNVRVIGNYLPYTMSAELPDMDVAVTYDADLQLLSVGALADWYPFSNQVRATAGLLYNNNRAKATIIPIESYEMNGRTFAPERIGQLDAEVKHGSSIAPYLGLGFGNPISRRVAFALDLGVVYTSAPTVHMHGDGMIAPTAKQAPDLESGFSSFRWWPVVNIGFNVNFIGR